MTRGSARNFISERRSERRDTTDAKLAAAKTIIKSYVWETFSKFDTKHRLDLKEPVACKICLKASEEDLAFLDCVPKGITLFIDPQIEFELHSVN